MRQVMRIDAHQHFWRIADRQGQWPPPSLAPIHRDFVPADLLPALRRCGVDATVLVQSLPTLADTDYLLDIAAHNAHVRGVVGWVDMTRPDAPQHIARLAREPLLKGLRPMLQDLPDDAWANDPAYDAAARAMIGHGLAFDALVRAVQLPALLGFARRHPRLRIVIDHAGKPPIARGSALPWRAHVAALAALPHVHCKLSGLLTEAGALADMAALAPWVDHLFAAFGPDRLIWGSDWPVLNLAADYDAWFAMATTLCEAQPGMDAAALAGVFGGNARRFYHLA
jgi:L-fuconolactonase